MLRRWLRPGSGCLRHHTRRLEARQSSCNWLRRKRLSWKNFATNDNSSPHLNLSEPSIKPPKNLAHHVHFRNEEVASSRFEAHVALFRRRYRCHVRCQHYPGCCDWWRGQG